MRFDSPALPERMLDVYLGLCTALWNNRITVYLPFNEAVVCNFLYKSTKGGGGYVTATELCDMTNISKSQMNRILENLEELGVIKRSRSTGDKRVVEITINGDRADLYNKEHEKNINIIRGLQEKFGQEKSERLTLLMEEFLKIIDEDEILRKIGKK